MTDVVTRLRAVVRSLRRNGWDTMANHVTEGVMEIERLRRELGAEKAAVDDRWRRCANEMPGRSGGYLCWHAPTQHMWIGAYNDSGGHDTWGDERPLGWVGIGRNPELWPTHWTRRPEPPQ